MIGPFNLDLELASGQIARLKLEVSLNFGKGSLGEVVKDPDGRRSQGYIPTDDLSLVRSFDGLKLDH